MLKKYIKKYKWFFLVSIILTILTVGSTLLQPRIITDIINELNTIDSDASQEAVQALSMKMVLVGAVGLFAGLFNTIVASKVAQFTGAGIRDDLFKKIQKFGYSDIEKYSASNLVVRMTNDVTQVQNFIMMGLQMVLRVPFMFIGAFVLAVLAIPSLWWTIIIYVIVVGLIVAMVMKFVGPNFGKLQRSIEGVNSRVKENLDGVRVVKSFAAEEQEQEKLESSVDILTKYTLKIGYGFSTMIPLFMLVANMLTAFVIYFMAGPAIDDPDLIGEIISFINYLMQISFALMMFGFVTMILGRATVSIKRINEVLVTESTIVYGANDLSGNSSSIKFDNVSFTYPNSDEVILEDISFEIKAGESVGIVGSTASGKTSLVSLIPRLYDVSKGEILINGVNVKDYSHKSLTDNISLVLQKPQLISGTIRESITEGKRDATEEQLIQASKDAQAYEFIERTDGKFEGQVLQKGNNFSGGQKQRLSIARGFIKDPSILILDDSTSALDARSENLVKEALNNNYTNMTKIIVSQKISSVVDLDKIIVLHEGKIDSIGTHKELVNNSEVYHEIYETQKGREVLGNE